MPIIRYDRNKINKDFGENIEKEYLEGAFAKDLAEKYFVYLIIIQCMFSHC